MPRDLLPLPAALTHLVGRNGLCWGCKAGSRLRDANPVTQTSIMTAHLYLVRNCNHSFSLERSNFILFPYLQGSAGIQESRFSFGAGRCGVFLLLLSPQEFWSFLGVENSLGVLERGLDSAPEAGKWNGPLQVVIRGKSIYCACHMFGYCEAPGLVLPTGSSGRDHSLTLLGLRSPPIPLSTWRIRKEQDRELNKTLTGMCVFSCTGKSPVWVDPEGFCPKYLQLRC